MGCPAPCCSMGMCGRESPACACTQAVEVGPSANNWLHDLLRSSHRYGATCSTGIGTAAGTAGQRASTHQRDPLHGSSAMPEAALPQRVFESTIDLSKGGKTHQIRAQLAAVGAPVIGDVMYGPIAGATAAGGAASEDLVRRVGLCQQIEGSIGLHAFRLVWDGRTYEALPSWQQV